MTHESGGEETGGCGRWGEELSGYVDGDLPTERVGEVARHLEGCAACRGVVADLREVKARARGLRDRLPERDLWPGIEAAIGVGAGAVSPSGGTADLPRRRGLFLTVPQLAAAATVVLLSGLGLGRMGWPAPDASRPSPEEVVAVGGAAEGAEARFVALEPGPEYAAEVERLQQIMRDEAGALQPATARVLEKNLAVIERAIEEARTALAADPGNAWVEEHLRSSYDRKLGYLRDAAELLEWQAGD